MAALDAGELAAIDAFLLETAQERFRKVAWLVMMSRRQMEDRHPMLPEVLLWSAGARAREARRVGEPGEPGTDAVQRGPSPSCCIRRVWVAPTMDYFPRRDADSTFRA